MQIIKSSEIQNKISELKKKNPITFNSNYFLNPLDEDIQILENENALIFLQREYDFYRLYFAYNSLSDFEKLLVQIPSNISYSIEILQKAQLDEKVKDAIAKYAPFDTTFIRMRAPLNNIKFFEKYNPQDIEYATYDDIDVIYDTMHNTFSKYQSHIQTKEILKEYVDKKWIIAPRDEKGNVASFLIYTISGLQSHNNQGININKNPIYGVKMIDYYNARMHELGIKNIYLWVDTIYNKPVQKMHELYGYKFDGLYNFIFVKN